MVLTDNIFYRERDIVLYLGDCTKIMDMIAGGSVNLIFADPPYFLSNGGISCKAGKMVCVDKADWDKSRGFKENFDFTMKWLEPCKKALKEGGSIWISGTPHNIYYIGFALQVLGFKILNEISWFKPNAPPNLSCRYFAHSHETVIWARNGGKHKFNYEKMKDWKSDKINPQGKQMRSVWSIPLTLKAEKNHGIHPTQKPIELLRRIIESSSDSGDVVLDPFNGSGTTGVVSKMLGRKYIGIDTEKEYLELTKRRLENI